MLILLNVLGLSPELDRYVSNDQMTEHLVTSVPDRAKPAEVDEVDESAPGDGALSKVGSSKPIVDHSALGDSLFSKVESPKPLFDDRAAGDGSLPKVGSSKTFQDAEIESSTPFQDTEAKSSKTFRDAAVESSKPFQDAKVESSKPLQDAEVESSKPYQEEISIEDVITVFNNLRRSFVEHNDVLTKPWQDFMTVLTNWDPSALSLDSLVVHRIPSGFKVFVTGSIAGVVLGVAYAEGQKYADEVYSMNKKQMTELQAPFIASPQSRPTEKLKPHPPKTKPPVGTSSQYDSSERASNFRSFQSESTEKLIPRPPKTKPPFGMPSPKSVPNNSSVMRIVQSASLKWPVTWPTESQPPILSSNTRPNSRNDFAERGPPRAYIPPFRTWEPWSPNAAAKRREATKLSENMPPLERRKRIEEFDVEDKTPTATSPVVKVGKYAKKITDEARSFDIEKNPSPALSEDAINKYAEVSAKDFRSFVVDDNPSTSSPQNDIDKENVGGSFGVEDSPSAKSSEVDIDKYAEAIAKVARGAAQTIITVSKIATAVGKKLGLEKFLADAWKRMIDELFTEATSTPVTARESFAGAYIEPTNRMMAANEVNRTISNSDGQFRYQVGDAVPTVETLPVVDRTASPLTDGVRQMALRVSSEPLPKSASSRKNVTDADGEIDRTSEVDKPDLPARDVPPNYESTETTPKVVALRVDATAPTSLNPGSTGPQVSFNDMSLSKRIPQGDFSGEPTTSPSKSYLDAISAEVIETPPDELSPKTSPDLESSSSDSKENDAWK